MPSWAFWALFLLAGALAIVLSKRLDDGDRGGPSDQT
jgi:hypothetical protein